MKCRIIQLPCGLTPPPCQGITHLGHGRQWYHCVLLCLYWRFGCDIVDLSRRSAKSWQVRLTSAVLLRLCGQIWVVCVPHWIVVFFVLVQTSETTGRFYTQVFVYVSYASTSSSVRHGLYQGMRQTGARLFRIVFSVLGRACEKRLLHAICAIVRFLMLHQSICQGIT